MNNRRTVSVCAFLTVGVFQIGAVYAAPPATQTLVATAPNGSSVTVIVPRSGITATELGVIVNTSDPQSVAVGEYYQNARNIPAENMIYVSFSPGSSVMSLGAFNAVKAEVDAAAGPNIQAFAITWTAPWRVDCMSLTSAFALGFSTEYCSTPCSTTKAISYFGSDSVAPYSDYGIRPTMVLGGTSSENVFELIDRSVAADQSFPTGDGHFIRTTDSARSVRWGNFSQTVDTWNDPNKLGMTYFDNSQGSSADNYLENVANVLYYFTGLAGVPQVASNAFLPGAIADHVTSYGGQLTNAGGQMSILRWLEAGASASYGTVVEPCNYTAKFPQTSILIPAYFGGGTAVEAYWKSVHWPGEGVFVGDPLTCPYGTRVSLDDSGLLEVYTTILKPGVSYSLQAGDNPSGPFAVTQSSIAVPDTTYTTITEVAESAVYKLAEDTPDTFSPTANIVSYSTGDVITGDVYITADAQDDTGIWYVELSIDGQVAGSANASPYSWLVDTTALTDGVHTFVATAFDVAGNSGSSAAVGLEVDNLPCNSDGVCELDEDCDLCPGDCMSVTGPSCGNGVCEAADGEDCITCPADCAGKQKGKTSRRFCCGAGGGTNPVSCADARCTADGAVCSDTPLEGSCGGDGVCQGIENSCNTPVDCGLPVANESAGLTCDDGLDNDCDGDTDCADADCSGDAACQQVGCDNDGVCDAGESCLDCSGDCAGKSNGSPRGRYCCGDGVLQSPEGDGSICDGNP